MVRRALTLLLLTIFLAAAAPVRLQAIAGTTLEGNALRVDPVAHQVVVVHYWATWCLPCRVEMPILDRAARRKGVQVIGIALDSGASRKAIRSAAIGIGFPLARAGDTSVPVRVLPRALPETLVYGRDGRLRARFGAGGNALSETALDQLLPALLAE